MTNKRVRVNIRSVANTKAARQEMRNGRAVMVVPSATLPDDIVMNDIRYPAAEIASSYATLNRTPAPLGHPTINGQFVSASDPEGINIGYVGAWNENARRDGGRVFLDKVIDIEVANRSEGGKRVLAAINAGDAVHTSTGLYCDLAPAAEGDGCKWVASNMTFDHDAILLGEQGAATPEQGVGMMVNGKQIEVINSAVDWADRDLDWAVTSVVEALEKRQKAGLVDRLKSLLIEAFAPLREKPLNEKDADMADEKQLEALSATVNALKEANDKIGETIANAVAAAVKPLIDAQATLTANAVAAEAAAKAELVAKVVKANLLSEDAAKATPVNVLTELVAKVAPGKAAALNGAPITGNATLGDFAAYDPNAAMEVK
jgi:hypothetical protein